MGQIPKVKVGELQGISIIKDDEYCRTYDCYWWKDIVIHIDREVRESTKLENASCKVWAWKNGGSTRLPVVGTPEKNPEEKDIDYVKRLFEWADSLGDVCTTCSKDREGCTASHFAARYCLTCWQEYAARNSEKCSICGEPRSSCSC